MDDFDLRLADDSLLSEFIENQHPVVREVVVFILHLLHHPVTDDVAHDLTAEIEYSLIKGHYRNLRTFQRKSSFKTWVNPIAFHHIGDFLRKRKKSPVSLDDLTNTLLSNIVSPEKKLMQDDQLRLAKQAIAILSEREQLLLRLCVVEELHAKEVAEIMGIKIESV